VLQRVAREVAELRAARAFLVVRTSCSAVSAAHEASLAGGAGVCPR